MKASSIPDYVPAPIEIPSTVADDLKKLAPLFAVGRGAHDLGQRMHAALDQPTRSAFQTVAYVAFGKAFRTLQSTMNLSLCGCGVDAIALCGSLFENVVDLRYMEKAPVLRPRRYTQFEQVEKLYQAEKILRHKRLPFGKRRLYAEYRRDLQPQVAKLTRYFPKRSLGWAQHNLKERAKAVGMEIEYEELYWIFCGYKHTFPAAAQGFMVEQDGDIDVSVGPSVKGVFNAMFHAIRYFLNICEVINRSHALRFAADIEEVGGQLVEASDSALRDAPEACE